MIAIIFLLAFFWAVKSGQYEDTHSPAVRILFDDKPQKKLKEEEETQGSSPEETDKS